MKTQKRAIEKEKKKKRIEKGHQAAQLWGRHSDRSLQMGPLETGRCMTPAAYSQTQEEKTFAMNSGKKANSQLHSTLGVTSLWRRRRHTVGAHTHSAPTVCQLKYASYHISRPKYPVRRPHFSLYYGKLTNLAVAGLIGFLFCFVFEKFESLYLGHIHYHFPPLFPSQPLPN